MFVNFSVLNHVFQLCQRMAKYALSIEKLYQKYITRGMFASFWGHTKLTNKNAHQFWPLRTAFELKNCTVDNKKIRRMRPR